MTPGEKPYICYKCRKYRDIERRLENTYGEGDCVRVVDTEQGREPVTDTKQEEPVLDSEQRGPMADDTKAKQFGEALKSVQDLARQIEVMGQRFIAVEAR